MQLLQIIFHQDCDSCSIEGGSFLYDFIKDFILPVSLAIIAAYAAFYIFIKEGKRDKIKEDQVQAQEELDKLNYLSFMVQDIISTSEQQSEHILAFVEELKTNPLDIPLLTFLSINNLRRITVDLNLEKYLLSYVSHFAEDRPKAIKEFNEIIASIDMLHEIFKSIPEQLIKAVNYDYERKTRIQEIHAKAHNLLGPLTIKLNATDIKVANEFGALGNKYMAGFTSSYDLRYFYNEFFIPFNAFATRYLGKGRPEDPELQELAILTRDGKQNFAHAISENETFRDQFLEDYQRVKDTVESLKLASVRLRPNF